MNQPTIGVKLLYFPLTRIILGSLVWVAGTVGAVTLSRLVLQTVPIDKDYKEALALLTAALTVLTSYRLLFAHYEHRPITELRFAHIGTNLLQGFGIGFALQSVVILIIYLGGGYTLVSVNPFLFILPAFVVALCSGAILEEVLFRAILFRVLEEKVGSLLALGLSASLFGFYHLGNANSNVWTSVAIIPAGLLLGAVYIYSRNLWLPIFLHFGWNFTETAIFGAPESGISLKRTWLVSQLSGPDLLTGGAFGPENSLQTQLLCLLVTIIVLARCLKQHKLIQPFWSAKRAEPSIRG